MKTKIVLLSSLVLTMFSCAKNDSLISNPKSNGTSVAVDPISTIKLTLAKMIAIDTILIHYDAGSQNFLIGSFDTISLNSASKFCTNDTIAVDRLVQEHVSTKVQAITGQKF